MYFLNARSLLRHFKDVQKDLNLTSAHTAIFSETRFSSCDSDNMYAIDGFKLFRNDCNELGNKVPILYFIL